MIADHRWIVTRPRPRPRKGEDRHLGGVNASTRQETRIGEIIPACSGVRGPRHEFKIALGLRAGYGSAGRIYDLEEAVRTAHRWMRERAARGEPFLSGMFTRGEVVYADSGGEAASHREPIAIFAGEVLPQYASDLDDGTVRELLDELAGEMGRTLEQEEVHIAYRDRTWTLKAQ